MHLSGVSLHRAPERPLAEAVKFGLPWRPKILGGARIIGYLPPPQKKKLHRGCGIIPKREVCTIKKAESSWSTIMEMQTLKLALLILDFVLGHYMLSILFVLTF